MLTIDDRGERNVLQVDPGSAQELLGTLILTGNDNQVVIGPECRSQEGFRLELGSNSTVRLDGRGTLGHLFAYLQEQAHLHIGFDCGFNGAVRVLMHEPGRVEIGNGALFAGEIDVTISDMHSIIDATTEKRINPPADISIGNRVWIGQRCMVLKGSSIGDGSVIGSMSLVRGTLPGNSICAGVPAKVIRSGATWRFTLLPWEPIVPREPAAGAAQPVADAEPTTTAAGSAPGWLGRKARGGLARMRDAGRALRGKS